MSLQDPTPRASKQAIYWAIAVSLIFHAAVLFFPRLTPKFAEAPARRLQATLAPRPLAPPDSPAPPPAAPPAASPAETKPAQARRDRKILAIEKPQGSTAETPAPTWSTAEQEDMNKFLRELEVEKKAAPPLAQRALAMARTAGRQQAQRDDDEAQLLERIPNSAPVDPLALEMYLDGLVGKLNRSAGFVKNDPRSRGMKTATVLVRLNPDGSLQSFRVLNAADQQDEIAHIKSVVERAVPFPAFPPDLRKSARSLAMFICIFPASSGAGFGFTRRADGRGC